MTSKPAVLPPVPLADAAAVRALVLHIGRRVDGLLQGDHPGHLPGPGSEPAEARPYVVGDDVRRIDWALTARAGDVHVRTTVAERELDTTVVLDLSASMTFGTAMAEKRDVALALAAAFLHLGGGPGDRVGAVVTGPDGVTAGPLRGSREGVLLTLHGLLRQPRTEGGGAALGDALDVTARTRRRSGFVVVISDLLDPVASWERRLRLLAARQEVVVVQVVDRRELALPDVGALRVVDPETGRHVQVTTSTRLRKRYAEAAAQRLADRRRAVRSAGADHAVVHTERDWLPQLGRFLATRRRARGAARQYQEIR